MATIAIGDIHGNYRALADLMEKLLPQIHSDDSLVFLGDYIDRGPNTKRCVDAIIRLMDDASFEVVTLLGNHEEWMLGTMRDYTRHSWLLNLEAFDTIASYSVDAASQLRKELEAAGPSLFAAENIRLPYQVFFDAIPASHVEFFQNLQLFHRNEDIVCVHGGLDPSVEPLEAQRPRDITWGCDGFPERYRGGQRVVYGHRNYRDTDEEGAPIPHILSNGTFGMDPLSSGVLTAMRFPDGKIFQSRRYSQDS